MATKDDALKAVVEGDADALRATVELDPEAADAIDAHGVPILMQAIYSRRRDLIDILLAAEPTLDVFEAAALGERAWLEDLLDIDPEAAAAHAADGFTALHLAAFFGHEDCMRVLLARGADLHAVARNAMRVMPLHSAAASHRWQAVELLLDHGAQVDAQQHGGWTALQSAAMNGDEPMVAALLRRGANAGLVADDGRCAVQLAEQAGHAQLASQLLSAKNLPAAARAAAGCAPKRSA